MGVMALFLFGCASMESRFRMAKQKDTIEDYEKFVKKYPASSYSDEARSRLEQLKDEKAFKEVEAKNTTAAYRDFVQKYPNSRFIEVVKKRIDESDEEAFVRTWGIGTIQAIEGFRESYPESKCIPIAADGIEFLKTVESGKLEAYSGFIKAYPNNPFVLVARASFPILWLGETLGKVGVIINIGEIVNFKGILKGYETEEEAREKVFRKLKENLEKEGVQAVLLSSPEDVLAKEVTTLLIIDYKESEGSLPKPLLSHTRGYGWMVDVLFESSVEMTKESVFGPDLIIPHFTITIKDTKTGWEYYSTIPSLYYKVSKQEILHVLAGSRAADPMLLKLFAYDLKDEDWVIRARSGPDPGKDKVYHVTELLTALKDEDSDVRRRACELLGKLRDTSAVEPLIGVLKDEQRVQWAAIEALGKIRDPRAVRPLLSLLVDGEWFPTRERVVLALGEIGDKSAIETLRALAENDPSEYVRKAAREVLDKIERANQ
jgi:hypothetical protein